MKTQIKLLIIFNLLGTILMAAEPTIVNPQEQLSLAIQSCDAQSIRQITKTAVLTKKDLDLLAYRLLDSLDTQFDPSISPEMKAQPPSGWNSGGTDPEGVVDPKERAEYAESIKQIQEKLAKHRAQRAIYESLVRILDTQYVSSDPKSSEVKSAARDLKLLEVYLSEKGETKKRWDVVTKWHSLINKQEANKAVDSTATRVTPPADPSLRSGQESRHGQP